LLDFERNIIDGGQLAKDLDEISYFEKSLAHGLPNTSINNGIKLSLACWAAFV
jgi:hypothetical protein